MVEEKVTDFILPLLADALVNLKKWILLDIYVSIFREIDHASVATSMHQKK